MTEEEFTEQLADKEHASWARWMEYVFSLCKENSTGTLIIPADRVAHWKWEIATAYADLPEEIKHWDREEVKHILPIIQAYIDFQGRGVPRLMKQVEGLKKQVTDAMRAVELLRVFIESGAVGPKFDLEKELADADGSNTALPRALPPDEGP